MSPSVLLVIPDKQNRSMLSLLLRDMEFAIDACADPVEAFDHACRKPYSMAILAFEQSLTSCDQWIQSMREACPHTAILLLARREDLEFIMPLLPLGVTDVLVHPFNPKTVTSKLRRFIAAPEAPVQSASPAKSGSNSPFPTAPVGGSLPPFPVAAGTSMPPFGAAQMPAPSGNSLLGFQLRQLTGRSAAFRKLKETIAATRNAKTGVLLHGEPGCEYEIIMREIAAVNGDSDGYPIVCEATEIDSETLQSLEASNRLEGGPPLTVFLSRVDQMTEASQRMLIEFMRGIGRRQRSNPRSLLLVVSCAQSAADAANHGSPFIEELLFFLSQEIVVPPLRERPEDIPLLARRILTDLIHLHPTIRVRGIDPSALVSLSARRWRGNYAELLSVLRKSVFACTHRVLRMENIDPFLASDYNPDTEREAEVIEFHRMVDTRSPFSHPLQQALPARGA